LNHATEHFFNKIYKELLLSLSMKKLRGTRKKKEGKNATAKIAQIIILVIAIMVIIVIAVSFMVSLSNENNAEKEKGLSAGGNLETKLLAAEKNAENTDNLSSDNLSIINHTPSASGGPSGESSVSSASSASSDSLSQGKLVITNYISGYSYNDFTYSHVDGAEEGVDNIDGRYYAMWGPEQTISSKLVSKINGVEYSGDIRPPESRQTISIELSLISKSGDDITIDSVNQLQISIPLPEYTFEGKTLTLQQYDPADLTASYPVYNVRDVISSQNGIIELPLLNGTYSSEAPYAYFYLRII
jgi:hypothetical protein